MNPTPSNELSFPQTMVINAISRWYPSNFPEQPHEKRPLWRRAEYPIVLTNGWPVPVWKLFPILAEQPDLSAKTEGDTITALVGDRLRLEAGVGWGTIAIVVGPYEDLHQLKAAHEAAAARVLAGLAQIDGNLLGYGAQPMTPAHEGLITKTELYAALNTALDRGFRMFAVTASDQLRVGVAQHELVDMLNLGCFAGPLVNAFCGNSPIYGMADNYYCAGRHNILRGAVYGEEQARYGILDAPFESISDMVARFAKLRFVLQIEDEKYATHAGSFLDYVDAAQATGVPTGQLVGAYLFHESLIWPYARLRIDDGTLSLRAACQQPWEDHMAACALNFGFITAGWKLHDFFHTYIDPPVAPRVPPGIRQPPDPPRAPWDSWHRMHAFDAQPIAYGMEAREPFTALLEGALQVAHDALAARGLGEEVYLEPLWQRLADKENPAQRIRRVFHRQGPNAMLEKLLIRP